LLYTYSALSSHSPPTTLSYPLPFFFFYSSRDHRDLHSFPTRRSSDLSRSFPIPAVRPSWTRGRRTWTTAARAATGAIGRRTISIDRKSTRLNSSHDQISYAVFCLKKKKKKKKKKDV